MLAQGFLVAGVVAALWWASSLAVSGSGVPPPGAPIGRALAAWMILPAGIACLVVGVVLAVWSWLGGSIPDDAGVVAVGAAALVALVISRGVPERWYPSADWRRWMQQAYLGVGAVGIVLIAASPWLAGFEL